MALITFVDQAGSRWSACVRSSQRGASSPVRETPPLPCVSTVFVAKALPLHFVPTALCALRQYLCLAFPLSGARHSALPSASIAFTTKTLPSLAVRQVGSASLLAFSWW